MNELVPEFSKEDFSSSKPYEYLYATISNGFVHEALREKISDMAISVGFKAFKRIYKKYCGQVGGVESKSVGNLTDFSKQPMQLESGDWMADDTGIYCEGRFGTIYACRHPIIPYERILNVDTNMETNPAEVAVGHSFGSLNEI